jgi:hypothetical protein
MMDDQHKPDETDRNAAQPANDDTAKVSALPREELAR